MNKSEIALFKQLCSFKETEFDEALLDAASPEVLGQLFFNRMQVVAYGTLKKHSLLDKVNREFRNSLRISYESNLTKNESFFACVRLLQSILADCGCRYVMLKGAYLCRYYPEGYRTSNDIDLLVLPKDITAIGKRLVNQGFKQGHIRNGIFVPATRKEIIESKMTRGETVPYIKEVLLPGMRYLEVDINFSLEYKPGDTEVLHSMLDRAYTRNIDGLEVTTLDDADYFIHLCSHLYKEATTLPWVEMKRDMTLYKFADIYMLLYDNAPNRKESPLLSTVLTWQDSRTGEKRSVVMRDLVFINYRTGEPAKNSSYDTHLYKLCDKAGIEHFSMHALRHTFATRAIERGMPPKVLQRLLGHVTLAMTTDRYVHVTDDSMFDAMRLFEAADQAADQKVL